MGRKRQELPRIPASRLRVMGLCVIAGFAIVACKPDLAEVTDAEILELFGEETETGLSIIPRRTLDCLEILSGERSAGAANATNEEMEVLQPICEDQVNRQITRWKSDSEFSAADVAQTEFVSRVQTLAETQNLAVASQREEAAQKIEEQRRIDRENRRLELQSGIDARLAELTKLHSDFIAAVTPLRADCAAYNEAYEFIRQNDRINPILTRGRAPQCGNRPAFAQIEDRLNAALDALRTLEIPEDPLPSFRIRNAPAVDFDRIASAGTALRARLEEVTAIVENLRESSD